MALIRTLILAWLLIFAAPLAASAQENAIEPAPVERIDTSVSQIDSDELRKAFRRVKRNNDIQFELRTDLPEPPPPPPAWLKALGEMIGAFFKLIAPLLVYAFWIGVGALGMVMLYGIVLGLHGLRDRAARDEDAPASTVAEYRPSGRMMRVLLSEADRLAAEGRYAEAVHLLLYRSIQDIEEARPDAVRLSLTSREIARSDALGPQTRTNFAALARIVERSHFGGRTVDAEDYAEARAIYERFAAPVTQAVARPPHSGVTA